MTKKRKKTALVLSGGGSRGAYEAGAWQALVETGIEIDIVTTELWFVKVIWNLQYPFGKK